MVPTIWSFRMVYPTKKNKNLKIIYHNGTKKGRRSLNNMSLKICLGLRGMPKNIIVPPKEYASKGFALMMSMMTILYKQLYRCRDFTPPSNVPAIS
jgi:hypothetical protein